MISALQEYTDEHLDGATDADWVPTATLLRIYRAWYATHHWRWDYDRPERLTVRQFGRAIRRVFPKAERCKRSYGGEQMYGYSHLSGPNSLLSSRLAEN